MAIGYEYIGDIDHKVASYLTEEWIQHLNFYSTRLDRMGMTLGDVKIASLLDQTVKVEVTQKAATFNWRLIFFLVAGWSQTHCEIIKILFADCFHCL